MTSFDPQVGDRCNWRLYTDVAPCTVIKRTAKTVTVRLDKAEIVKPPVMVAGGFAAMVLENATYEISENVEGRRLTFSLRGNGTWKQTGHASNSPGNTLGAGWHYYHDYSF